MRRRGSVDERCVVEGRARERERDGGRVATTRGARGGNRARDDGRSDDGDERAGVRTMNAREEGATAAESLEMDALRHWTTSMNRGEAERPSGMESVWKYCALELGFCVGEREDDPDMSHARERVFDLLWYIPLALEKFCLYGGLLCADAILGLFTSLPVRVMSQTVRLLWSVATLNSGDKSPQRDARGVFIRTLEST